MTSENIKYVKAALVLLPGALIYATLVVVGAVVSLGTNIAVLSVKLSTAMNRWVER